jgi:uncharacterized membrane protein YhaH (DUF805 family)
MSAPMYPPPPPSPPSPPPPPYNPPPTGGAPTGGAPAAQQVQGPAIGLLITAVIGIILGLLSLVMNVAGIGMSGMEGLGGGGATDQYMQYMSGGFGIVSAIIGLAISAFIIWAAMQMKQLRNWNMSVAASIVAMIPCIGPCCLIGIPIGIWSLIVLMKPEVKSAFVA